MDKKDKFNQLGSGCDSVGRAVASNTRDQEFESNHQQIFTINLIEKTNMKQKRGRV